MRGERVRPILTNEMHFTGMCQEIHAHLRLRIQTKYVLRFLCGILKRFKRKALGKILSKA